MNIKKADKLQFLMEWREEHLQMLHWLATELRDKGMGHKPNYGGKAWDASMIKAVHEAMHYHAQVSAEIKEKIDKLNRHHE